MGMNYIMKKDLISNSPDIIKEFLGYMHTVKGKSLKTIEEYFMDLRTFFKYIKYSRGLVDKNTDFIDITIDDVNIDTIKDINLIDIFEYMNFLVKERGNKEAARSRKCSSLRTFYKYLVNKAGYLKIDPLKELETPKIKKSLPKYLTLEESKSLLNYVKSHNGKYKERDYCIITLFLNCGMRLSELVSINVKDIRDDNTLKLNGKGDKERVIYLNEACRNSLDKYMKVRPNNLVVDKDALFISRNRKRISVKTIQMLVNRYLDLSGLGGKGYSTHKLRHTAATLMYQYGNVDIRVLKDILGHENLGTTEIYTHLSNKQVQSALDLNPLSSLDS